MDYYATIDMTFSGPLGPELARLMFRDPERGLPDASYVLAVLSFPASGEEREQMVLREDLRRVRRSTVQRRMKRQRFGATPHTLVKP